MSNCPDKPSPKAKKKTQEAAKPAAKFRILNPEALMTPEVARAMVRLFRSTKEGSK